MHLLDLLRFGLLEGHDSLWRVELTREAVLRLCNQICEQVLLLLTLAGEADVLGEVDLVCAALFVVFHQMLLLGCVVLLIAAVLGLEGRVVEQRLGRVST